MQAVRSFRPVPCAWPSIFSLLKADRGASHEGNTAHVGSAMQFPCGLGNHAALIACAGQLVFGRLTAAVAARDRGCTVGCASSHFVEFYLARKAVVEADNSHAEMQEIGDDGKQGGFLAAMLGRGRGEGSADLAVQRSLHPEAAGLIEEIRHL